MGRQNGKACPIPDLRWTAGGFSMEVEVRPLERLAEGLAFVSVVGTGGVAAVALLRADLGGSTPASLGLLLPWGIRALLLLGALLALSLTALWWAPRRRERLGVQAFSVDVGERHLRAEQLHDCQVVEQGLRLHTADGVVRVPGAGLSARQLAWLRDRILEVRARWLAREGTVPAAIEQLRTRSPAAYSEASVQPSVSSQSSDCSPE